MFNFKAKSQEVKDRAVYAKTSAEAAAKKRQVRHEAAREARKIERSVG